MIIRVFRARIRQGCVADFKEMVRTQSVPWLKNSEGLVDYFAGAPLDDDATEFVMVTLWRDLQAVEAFAGDDWAQPVVTEQEAPLVEEMFAHHYRSFDRDL